MKLRADEIEELRRALERTWDAFNALAFFMDHHPAHLRAVIANLKSGRGVSTEDLERTGQTLRGLASESLRALSQAHALSSVFFPAQRKDEAA